MSTQDADGGLPVDSRGNPAIDPTENVKALMEASLTALSREADLRDRLHDEAIKRMEREWIHQEKMSLLRAEFDKEIRNMESDRVDKIRSVDVANAAATAAQLLSAVTTLATTQQGTAETLRNQVAATAAAVAQQTERIINPILERVSLLEKSSYTGAGRSAVVDPAMADLVIEMKKISSNSYRREGERSATDPQTAAAMADIKTLLLAQSAASGKSQGFDASWKVITAVIGILFGFLMWQGRQVAPASVAPQVIYVPAPAAGSGAPLPGTTAPR